MYLTSALFLTVRARRAIPAPMFVYCWRLYCGAPDLPKLPAFSPILCAKRARLAFAFLILFTIANNVTMSCMSDPTMGAA